MVRMNAGREKVVWLVRGGDKLQGRYRESRVNTNGVEVASDYSVYMDDRLRLMAVDEVIKPGFD